MVATAALLLPAAPAAATFHLMLIREIHPAPAAQPEASYVELQMYAEGQHLIGGHSVSLYNSSAGLIGTFTFPSDLPDPSHNQQAILVGDSGVEAAFGVTPDLVNSGFNVPASGGAACWDAIDCVAWGSFSDSVASPVGTPADGLGIPDGMAIRRSISGGTCSNLLDSGDDTNDSATDFADATPAPQSYSTVPPSMSCTPPAPPPTATIDSKPSNPTNSTAASFTYHSTPSGAEFECKLDAEAFASCASGGKSYAGPLSEGSHTFQVRAHDVDGTGSPASYGWTVDTTPPVSTIDTHPNDPSPGTSASFTFHSSETGSTFECSLSRGANPDSFSACSSGKTYTGLEDGAHTFKVRATDKAANQGAPAEFGWTVDNSLLDTTPPETTIVSRPPNPSGSSTVSFAYESNEPGSSFECRLDAGAFAPCPSTGIAYAGVANGSHDFQVRAIDPSANVDPTPAGYTFDVFVIAAPTPPSPGTSPPPAAPHPGTAFAAGLAQVRGARALLRMGCGGQEGARCSGALRLLARTNGARTRRRAARRLTIGRGTYSLPAGSRRRLVRARLTRKGRRLVARARRRGVKVSLVGKGLRQRTLTLRAAARKRRAKR